MKEKEETGDAVGVNQGRTVLALHLSRPSPESTRGSMALLWSFRGAGRCSGAEIAALKFISLQTKG